MFVHPRYAKVRAIIVGFHLAAITLAGCPAPVRKIPEASWQRAAVRTELEGWSRRAHFIGWQLSPDDVKNLSIHVSETWAEARRTAYKPFLSYLRTINAQQSWYMFTGPDREPQRFTLSFRTVVKNAGDEEEVFLVQEREEVRVFDLGDSLDHPELIHGAFLGDHRVRRALFQSSWAGKSDHTFRRICQAFDRRLRSKRDDVDDTICRLISRPVEHPYHRDRERKDTVERELTITASGSLREQRKGERPRTTRKKTP